MNFKKLLTLSTVVLLFVLSTITFAQPYTTVYVDVTNGNALNNGQFETNGVFPNGPKKAISEGLPLLANGGTLVIKASGVNTYTEALDLSTGLPALTLSYTIRLTRLDPGGNNDINVSGAFSINKAGLVVNITTANGTERIVQGTSTFTFTAGTVNLAAAAAWTAASAATFNMVGASGLSNAAPTITGVTATVGSITLNYTGGSNINAGQEANYVNYALGAINVAKTGGTTVTLPYAVNFAPTNTADVINVTGGGASFSSTINLGLGDLVCSGDAVTVTGLVSGALSAAATIADIDISSVVATGAANITLNGGITWTGKDQAAAKDYINTTYAVSNSGTGVVSVGPVNLVAATTDPGTTSNTFAFRFENAAGSGTLNVGVVTAAEYASSATPATTYHGVLSLENIGVASIAGGNYLGFINNNTTGAGGTLTVTGATSVAGVLTNDNSASVIILGTSALTLSGSVAHQTNTGIITATTPGGLVVTATGASSFNGGLLSNLTINGAGTNSLITNASTMQDVNVLAGTLTVSVGTVGAPTLATGTTTVNGGTFIISNNGLSGPVFWGIGYYYKTTSFVELAGTVTLTDAVGANTNGNALTTLEIFEGNFTRTAGVFTAGTGAGINTIVIVRGTGAQSFDGGPLFQVENISFINSAAYINVLNSIRASATATISTASVVNFATNNLIMNQATGRVINNGNITVTVGTSGGVILGGGRIVAGGWTGNMVSPSGIEGTGIYSNITVDVGSGFTANVNTTGSTGVKFSGILRLYTGTLQINTGAFDFAPYGTGASVVRHVWNAGAGVALLTAAVGTWDGLSLVNYDLEYAFGDNLAAANIDVLTGSLEFPVANRVKNLKISATTTGAGSVYVSAARTFLNNLTVVSGARLMLGGILTSSGLSATHLVNGQITQNTLAVGEVLKLTGSGTLSSTNVPASALIDNLNVQTAAANTYTISGFARLGYTGVGQLFTVTSGVVTLTMGNVVASPGAAFPGDVYRTNVAGGTVILGWNMNVPNNALTAFNVAAAGTFDFANFNVIWDSPASFNSAAAATFLATGATTGGYLNYVRSAGLATTGALVPRIMISLGTTVTLGSASGVKDIFSDFNSAEVAPLTGILAMGAFDFTLAGGTWNVFGGSTYTGTGAVIITGPTNANLGGNIQIPNLKLNNTTNTATLVDNVTGAGVPNLTVAGVFTSTSGNLNLNASDIVLIGAAPLTYVAGLFSATTDNTITAADVDNGEFVFDNAGAQTISITATGLIMPNVRVNNTGTLTLDVTPNNKAYTVSKRLVLANTGDITNGAVNLLILGDGALVKRMNNGGILTETPKFNGVIDNQYSAAATITQAKEAKASIRNLYISNSAGIRVIPIMNLTVTTTLDLLSGNYDFEPVLGTIFTITMRPNSTVLVGNGNLVNSTSLTVTPLEGGPITLTYYNSVVRTTTGHEWPGSPFVVSTLNVLSDDGTGGAAVLVLGASSACGDFILNTDAASPSYTDGRFDLNGKQLSVTNVSSATLTRGILSSEAGGGLGIPNTPGTLAVVGNLTSTANASIMNVNVTAATMTLVGPFGQDAYAPATVTAITGATTTGTSTIAVFNGNLTSGGNVTINGAHTNGTITASANVTVATGGSMDVTSNLAFVGTANSTLTVPAIGATIGGITFNKTNNTNTVTLTNGNLATVGNTTFINGLFVTNANTFQMFVPAFGGGQGFTRTGVTGTKISHVVGNLAKHLTNAGGPGLAGSSEPRQEFPIGTLTQYKMVAVTFNPAFGLPTTPNTTLTVSAFNTNPGGGVGLPIKDGVAAGIDVARYPNFYWTIKSSPTDIGPTTPFDLELTATGFTDYDVVGNIRIIRRYGAVADIANEWLLQGTNTSYDNALNGTTPTIIQRGANAGLRFGGAVFTLGLKSNMSIAVGTEIPKQWMLLEDGIKQLSLEGVFVGNLGTLTFTAQSSNTAILGAVVSPASAVQVRLSPQALGDVVVTIIAHDGATNDFFAYDFAVNVSTNGTDVAAVEIPKEFALYQNFPNPFNPTTNIKFDLPKEANVSLKVYNILGQEVATLVDRVMSAGHQSFSFDASKLSSGMYIYRIQAGDFVQVKKMLLMK